MTMIACRECGEQISSTANVCPKCGAVATTGGHPMRLFWILLVIVAGAFVALLIYGASIPEYETNAMKVRKACEMLAAPDQRYICAKQYDDAIAKGRAASAK